MTVGKQFEKNFAMICFLLSPSGGKRKTHFSLQNSERLFCLPTVTPSPPVSAIMALNIMYRQKKTDGNRPRLPSVSVAFFVHNAQSVVCDPCCRIVQYDEINDISKKITKTY